MEPMTLSAATFQYRLSAARRPPIKVEMRTGNASRGQRFRAAVSNDFGSSRSIARYVNTKPDKTKKTTTAALPSIKAKKGVPKKDHGPGGATNPCSEGANPSKQ